MVDLNEVDKGLVDLVRGRYQAAEAEHKQFRDHAAKLYGLYRNLQDFRVNNRGRRDRDVVADARREWGAELFIPFAYRTVETIVPRMLAHRPGMNPLPRDEQAYGNVDNMRMLLEDQQERIKYELILQDIAKDGLIYGLGVQKVGWSKIDREVMGIEQGTLENSGRWIESMRQMTVVDDPYAEWVDPFDFLWDPFGHSVDTCDYVIHRTWRSSDYVKRMVEAKKWRAMEVDPTATWSLEDILSSSGAQRFDEIQEPRRQADGMSTTRDGAGLRHQILEYHDGRQVVTVLNGEFPVQVGASSTGELCKTFMTYRPTKVGGRMVGIGEIEPIVDLQEELNTLRGQRMDAGTMAINRGFAYDETAVNADDLVYGPNVGIPTNGPPRDFLMPLPAPDVPVSAFQESAAIAGDIESTTGISDSVAGADSAAGQTATGVQLVQQAASLRIENKTRRLGAEIIIPAGDAWVQMNQTRILEPRPIRVPNDDLNGPAWSLRTLGPAELRGRMAITMDDGSTMAKNVPQRRQDAQFWQTLVGNQAFNQQYVATQIARLLDADNPQAALAPQEPQIPASVMEQFIVDHGGDPESFTAWLDQQQAAQADPNAQAPQGAPNEQPQLPEGQA